MKNKCKCGHSKESHGDSIYKGDCYECGRELSYCPCYKEEKPK